MTKSHLQLAEMCERALDVHTDSVVGVDMLIEDSPEEIVICFRGTGISFKDFRDAWRSNT